MSKTLRDLPVSIFTLSISLNVRVISLFLGLSFYFETFDSFVMFTILFEPLKYSTANQYHMDRLTSLLKVFQFGKDTYRGF